MLRKLLLLNLLFTVAFSVSAQLENTTWSVSFGSTFLANVQFGDDGLMSVDAGEGQFVAIANYTVTGNTLTVTDLEGSDCMDTGTYTFTIEGDLLIFTLVEDPCPDRPSLFTMFTWTELSTGISNSSSGTRFSLYPNPSSGTLFVEHGSEAAGNVRIMDPSGRIVHTSRTSGERTVIDLASLAKGMYVLELRNVNGSSVRQFILD